MPTVFSLQGYRFFFYSNEGKEPEHIHVSASGKEAKFWLADISLARNNGFADHDLKSIARHIEVHRSRLIASWRTHFGH